MIRIIVLINCSWPKISTINGVPFKSRNVSSGLPLSRMPISVVAFFNWRSRSFHHPLDYIVMTAYRNGCSNSRCLSTITLSICKHVVACTADAKCQGLDHYSKHVMPIPCVSACLSPKTGMQFAFVQDSGGCLFGDMNLSIFLSAISTLCRSGVRAVNVIDECAAVFVLSREAFYKRLWCNICSLLLPPALFPEETV